MSRIDLRTALLAAAVALLASACGDSASPKPEASNAPATNATNSSSPSGVAFEQPAPSAPASAAVEASASASPTSSAKAVASGGPKVDASGDPVKGEEKTGPAFSAYMTGAKSYKAGQPGSVTAIVNALGDYHVNPEFPYKVKLDSPPSGVTFPQDTVRDVTRSEKRATMSIPFTASEAGTKTISGTCSLSVCTKDQCTIEKVPLSVTVKVE